MSISHQKSAERCQVKIDDEMTIYTAAEHKQTLLAHLEDCQEMELDLASVSEMDSAGLQVLLLTKQHAESQHREFRIVNHAQAVVEVMELTQLAGHFGDPVVIPAEWSKQ